MITTVLTCLTKLDDTSVSKLKKPEKVKGYLWFGVVVIKVVEGAVVGVISFVQQLYCQRPAERLGHKGVLQRQEGDAANQKRCLKIAQITSNCSFLQIIKQPESMLGARTNI